jgi:hypothetical protein
MNRNDLRAILGTGLLFGLLATAGWAQTLTPMQRRALAQTNTELNLSAGELHSLGLLAPEDRMQQACPLGGTAKGARIKAANVLKNRDAIPTPANFDPAFTLAAVLAPGNDTARWNQSRAGVLVGYAHNAKPGGIETVNCGAKAIPDRDTHIELVLSLPDSAGKRRVIVEVTPRMRKWAKAQGFDWSTPTLEKTLIGHKVEIRGWVFDDFEHAPNAENTHPRNKLNWRATTWELHPITSIRIIQ